MRVLFLIVAGLATTMAFVPAIQQKRTTTELAVHRRDVLAGFAGLVLMPGIASAGSTFFFDEKIEQVYEPSQQATGGKVDLNNAFVDEYMQFPGMYPRVAGKIASNGPYDSVKDMYKIEGLTDRDKSVMKKYESAFTVNEPGPRTFNERINARVST